MSKRKEVFGLELVRTLKENKMYEVIIGQGGFAEPTSVVRDDPLYLINAINAFDFKKAKDLMRPAERLLDKLFEIHEEEWEDRSDSGTIRTDMEITVEQFEVLEKVVLVSPGDDFQARGAALRTINHIRQVSDDRKSSGKDEKEEDGEQPAPAS